jgi:acetylornithine deacetylase/succinyl-diaminopimelate desuccinylase-like protein
VNDALLEELHDWLRIPSISTGDGDPAAVRQAAEWVVERVRAAGGEAELVETSGNPVAVGELRAAAENAPTVLIYGHYDVQRTRRRSSRRCATAACTRAAPPTTRATSCRSCTSPARWRAPASCR